MTETNPSDDFVKGSKVWASLQQEEGWLPGTYFPHFSTIFLLGTIIEFQDQQARILLDNGTESTIHLSLLFLQNPSILEGNHSN